MSDYCLESDDPALKMLNIYMSQEMEKVVNSAVTEVWHATKNKIKTIKAKVKELEESMEPLKKRVVELEAEVKSLNKQLIKKENTCEMLKQKIEDVEQRISQKNKTIISEEMDSSSGDDNNCDADDDSLIQGNCSPITDSKMDSFSDLEERLFNKNKTNNKKVQKSSKNASGNKVKPVKNVKDVQECKRNRSKGTAQKGDTSQSKKAKKHL